MRPGASQDRTRSALPIRAASFELCSGTSIPVVTRKPFLLAMFVVSALVASACGSSVGTGSGVVSVADATLSRSDVIEYLDGWAVVNGGVVGSPLDRELSTGGIEFWVQTTALEQELGSAITAADRTAGKTWAADTFADLANGSAAYEALVAWWSTRLAVSRDLNVGLDPSEDELRARLDEINENQPETVCASHILVETEEQAVAVLERIADGEEFTALAPELSLDPGSGANGGSLGCVARGQYVEGFEEAVWDGSDGDMIGPLETEFGFHIILHEGFTMGFEFDEVEVELRDQVIQERNQLVNDEHAERMAIAAADAKVSVDPRYGEWDSTTGLLVSPEGAGIEGVGIEGDDSGLLEG